MKIEIMAVDVETGGLDASSDPLLEVGFYSPETGVVSFYLGAGGKRVTESAARVNGYPEAYVGRELSTVGNVIDFLRRHSIKNFVAHNAPFDSSFLRHNIEHVGGYRLPRFFCTMTMAHVLRLVGGYNSSSISLDAMLTEFGIDGRGLKHGAGQDAELTYRCYERIVARLKGMQQLADSATWHTEIKN